MLGLRCSCQHKSPTASREFFLNHSIKKWSDLNDNIICFIAILDVLVQKMVTKKHKKFRSPGPEVFLNFTNFLTSSLIDIRL